LDCGDAMESQNPHFWQKRPEVGHPGDFIFIDERREMVTMKSVILTMSLVLAGLSLSVAQQAQSAPPPAPIPTQIGAAKTVFISNAQGEEIDPRTFLKTFDEERPYNQFFAALASGGRFKPVLAPADADLILDFRLRAYAPAQPAELRLVVLDPKTHAVLWAFIETVKRGAGPHWEQKTEKNFDDAMTALVGDLTRLASAGSDSQK
jgi:hypothetical protein